jgi:hypothetical protein
MKGTTMIVNTKISWGYLPLLDIFGKANNLALEFSPYYEEIESTEAVAPGKNSTVVVERQYTRISYEDNSDTAISITYLSFRHLGFENMLCDYLIHCNVDPVMIPVGQYVTKKSDKEMEDEWQEHRRKIGLAR